MKPLYMVRYGEEKKHLEDLVNGKLRFAPSQVYIEIEKFLHDKGQGDLLEGRMKIKVNSGYIENPEKGEIHFSLPNIDFYMTIQDVNNIPIFCLSQYDIDDTRNYISNDDYEIAIAPDKLDCIRTDFPKAKYALIIFEPEKFIADVQMIDGHDIYYDEIKYYDYEYNSLQMYNYIAYGIENLKNQSNPRVIQMEYKNRHRHLYCKDICFSKQQEYRFVVLDEQISMPQIYNYTFNSLYAIISLDELETGIHVKNRGEATKIVNGLSI